MGAVEQFPLASKLKIPLIFAPNNSNSESNSNASSLNLKSRRLTEQELSSGNLCVLEAQIDAHKRRRRRTKTNVMQQHASQNLPKSPVSGQLLQAASYKQQAPSAIQVESSNRKLCIAVVCKLFANEHRPSLACLQIAA